MKKQKLDYLKMNRLSNALILSSIFLLTIASSSHSQGIAEMGALTGMGSGLGSKAHSSAKSVQRASKKNYGKFSKMADGYFKAAKRLEGNKKPWKAAQYYAAYSDTRVKLPNGKDLYALSAYDKATLLARKAGKNAMADLYEQKAYNLCVAINGKDSEQSKSRKKRLDQLSKVK